MVRRVRRRQIELTALPFNVYTEACSTDELHELLRLASEVKSQHALQIPAAIQTDVPGSVVGLVDALSLSGVRYLSVAHNWDLLHLRVQGRFSDNAPERAPGPDRPRMEPAVGLSPLENRARTKPPSRRQRSASASISRRSRVTGPTGGPMGSGLEPTHYHSPERLLQTRRKHRPCFRLAISWWPSLSSNSATLPRCICLSPFSTSTLGAPAIHGLMGAEPERRARCNGIGNSRPPRGLTTPPWPFWMQRANV